MIWLLVGIVLLLLWEVVVKVLLVLVDSSDQRHLLSFADEGGEDKNSNDEGEYCVVDVVVRGVLGCR